MTFDNTTAHYNNVSALFSITFDYPEKDENCLIVLDEILAKYEEYDTYLSTMLGNALQENLNKEVSVIMVIVAIIVLLVVTLTSESYGEVPVLVLTFVSAMILNMGTNFLMGTISFISNSVTSTLQLALHPHW